MRTSAVNTRLFPAMGLTTGLVIWAAVCGCGRDDGPPRYHLSGNISYEGEPIAHGWIVFSPESGPGATANIEDGKYATREAFGTVGGVHTVEVVAFDAKAFKQGKASFSCKFKKDIPKETTSWDIEISRADIEQMDR